jgi:hypothetical protein
LWTSFAVWFAMSDSSSFFSFQLLTE